MIAFALLPLWAKYLLVLVVIGIMDLVAFGIVRLFKPVPWQRVVDCFKQQVVPVSAGFVLGAMFRVFCR